MIEYLLDADTAIYAMKRRPAVVNALLPMPFGKVAMSAIVHSQLLQGVPNSPLPGVERGLIALLIQTVCVMSYGEDASEVYGDIVSALGVSKAHTIDRMIAAHAISLGATLVTNNTRDFAGIPGLKLANWAEAAPPA